MMRPPNSDIINKRIVIGGHLPEEIMEDILVKLPVKSIVRFKTVSKSWFDLIKSGCFIRKHLSRSEEIFVAKCFTFPHREYPGQRWVLDVYQCDDDDHKEESESVCQIEAAADYTTTLPLPPVLRYELQPFHCSIHQVLVGECYGVLCSRNNYNIMLVNPSLAEVKNIPIPIPLSNYQFGDDCRFIGFGFDNLTNNFKVVRMTESRYVGSQERRVEVYSVRSNAWRILDEIQIPVVVNYSASHRSTSLNGIVHWCVYTTEEQPCWRIITFNLATELFQIMEIPQDWCNNYPREKYSVCLLVLNQKSLAFISYIYPVWEDRSQSQFVNVWIRKKHGIQETWTKLYSIGHLPLLQEPLSFLNKDKLLYETKDRQLILYDLINQRGSLVFGWSHIRRYRKNRVLSCEQMGVCGSSLISINM